MTILMLIGMVFVIIWDVPLEDTFKLCAYTAASDFYEWVQVEIDVYIPHCKYQAKPHSSPSFSGACAAVIVHRNHFFLYQQNTSSESKAKFRKASHCCKTVLEAAKLAYATKTTSLPRNMALMTFCVLLIVFSREVNLLYLLYSTAWMCCLPHLIKQNYFLKTFLRTLILMTLVAL